MSSCSVVWWYSASLKLSLFYFTIVIFYTWGPPEATTTTAKQFLIAFEREKNFERL